MWWQALGTLLLSALSLAVGAGWISSSTARRVSRIQAHLDIVEALKTGPAHDALRARAEDEVLAHVAALESAPVRRWRRASAGFALASVVGGVGLGAIVILRVFAVGDISGWLLTWASVGSIALTLTTMAVVNRTVRLTAQAAEDERDEHQHDPS